MKFIYTVIKPKCIFHSKPMTIEEVETGAVSTFLKMNGVMPGHEVHRRLFTGYADCEGKEIYQGHILEYTYNRDTYTTATFTEAVEFERTDDYVGFRLIFSMRYKIVGNIYENADLL